MLLTTACHMAARDIEHSNECSWQWLWIMMPNLKIYKCLNKMTPYLQTTLFDKEVIFFLISLSIYVGVQLTISLLWFWTEDLPLPEPVMTRLYMIWNSRPWRRDIISSRDIFGECSGIIIWHLVERVHWLKKHWSKNLADISCFIGPSTASVICMEIHTKIVSKRKKKHFERPPTDLIRGAIIGVEQTDGVLMTYSSFNQHAKLICLHLTSYKPPVAPFINMDHI